MKERKAPANREVRLGVGVLDGLREAFGDRVCGPFGFPDGSALAGEVRDLDRCRLKDVHAMTHVEREPQAIFGRNGESPIPVLAAKSPGDTFYCAVEAIKIATRYMVPVMLLSLPLPPF